MKSESERQVVLCRQSCVTIQCLLCNLGVTSIHACCRSALDLFWVWSCLFFFLQYFGVFLPFDLFFHTVLCVCCVSRNHTDTDLDFEIDRCLCCVLCSVVVCGYRLLLLCFDPVLKLSGFFLPFDIIFGNRTCFFFFYVFCQVLIIGSSKVLTTLLSCAQPLVDFDLR